MTWQYVPIQGAMCRDGSATGIAVLNLESPVPEQPWMILPRGRARRLRFNATTCSINPSSFGMSDFTSRLGSTSGAQGIFNRADMANPVADWNFVYVPFCTGDIHAGNNPNATITGVTGLQQFVGYANVTRYLARHREDLPRT